MAEKKEIKFCSSCGSTEIEVTGNKYYCTVCDVTYNVTTAGTKVVSTDPLKKQNDRIEQLAEDVEQLKGKKPAEKKPLEPGPDSNIIEKEEDEEPEGFITIED